MEKKITVEEFVNKYNACKTKDEQMEYVDKIITRKYAPVIEKKVVLQTLLEKSILKNKYNVEYLDMFLSRINSAIAIILLYTNLSVKKDIDKNGSAFDDYDLLKENGLIEIICDKIGEREISELGTINGLIIDTYVDQLNNPAYVVSNNVARLSLPLKEFLTSGLNQFLQILKNEKQVDEVKEKVIQFLDNKKE